MFTKNIEQYPHPFSQSHKNKINWDRFVSYNEKYCNVSYNNRLFWELIFKFYLLVFSSMLNLFFNVMASGGLYSIIYITIHSPYLLSLCSGHISLITDHMIQITCYMLYYPLGCFCPCRDFLSILQSWTCCVWTVSIQFCGVDHLISVLDRTISMLNLINSYEIIFHFYFGWFPRNGMLCHSFGPLVGE